MNNDTITFVERKAYAIREWSLKQAGFAGSGHPTSCLSAADIVSVLFFHVMKYDPHNFDNPDADRFILSKGHASPMLYAVWKEVGVLSENDLKTYRQIDSPLEGHPTFRFSHTEAATGSLGIGLSIAAGMALNAQLDNRNYKTYVLLGDSECSEGSVWEAVQLAAHYKLNNLIGIVDCNRLGQSTETMIGHDTKKFARMFAAFGWHTIEVDGHDVRALITAFDAAGTIDDKPVMIIAKTFKGHGIDAIEDKMGFHGKALKGDQLKIALEQLQKNFPDAAAYKDVTNWQPAKPIAIKSTQRSCNLHVIKMPACGYKKGELLATRKAYGTALAALGDVCDTIVSLDAEVKNSTFAQTFEEKHPQRFFQCFIAEQNMLSMAVGFDRRGKIPFVSTFGAFFSRAYDQIRMAGVGQASLRLAGSHCGVSIGQDGPSQMALEDIAMMRAIPESIIFYPSDAVSTHALVGQMARYEKGVSYIRTTRMDTPVLYDAHESFEIGGCKILKQSEKDVACVIGAGVTLHEALKAYDQLQKEGISVAVIDLYSIKPLDAQTIIKVARNAKNKLIIVEDHYRQGGIGDAVRAAVCNEGFDIKHLAVDSLPRSGKPAELMALFGIDAHAIIGSVNKF